MTVDQKLHMLIGAYAVQIIILETEKEQLKIELEQLKEKLKAEEPVPSP